MLQNPTLFALLAAAVVILLYRKGYIKWPGGSQPSGSVIDLGQRWIAEIRKEAEDEFAKAVAKQTRDEVKAKLQAPFAASGPTEDHATGK